MTLTVNATITLQQVAHLTATGDYATARQYMDQLILQHKEDADIWYLKGRIHFAIQEFSQAISSYTQALRLRPEMEISCHALATTYECIGQIPAAIRMYAYWLKLLRNRLNDDPGAQPLLQRGLELCVSGRYGDAETSLLAALQRTNDVRVLVALKECWRAQSSHARAAAACRLILSLTPDDAETWLQAAQSYFIVNCADDCLLAYAKVISLVPLHTEALAEAAQIQLHFGHWGQLEERLEALRRCIEQGESCDPSMAMVLTPEHERRNAQQWIARHYPQAKAYDPNRALPADARIDSRLRIGYLSADFYQHATLALVTELFERHDKNRFSIYAYSYGKSDDSTVRRRVVQSVEQFHDISLLSDADAAEKIVADGIDILVDLKGLVQGHRHGIVAQRPAPIIMHYLGHPGTSGSPAVDYFLGDAIGNLPKTDSSFTEAVIRLPHSYQMNDRQRPLPEAKPRSEYGLPEGAFVFCAFNNAYKIRPDIFSVWMRVLAHMPGSVLWFHESHAEATGNLIREAAAQGIDASRLIPATTLPPAEHLARYAHADLCLDTFPVCGHTTTSDALWCGVPVVTLAGEHFISRVSASLLTAVSLPELMTHSMDAYEAKILELAKNPAKLNALRQHLQEGRMTFPLFDSAATTRAIEAAYLHAATLHRHHSMPQAFQL